MSNNFTWAEVMQRLVESWHLENPVHPIQRQNFLAAVGIKKVATWDEFKGLVNDQFPGELWVFRGQSDSSWRLDTSLERAVIRHRPLGPDGGTFESYITRHPNDFECYLLQEVQQIAQGVADRPPAKHFFDWFDLMQHYGVPTRLLDWTHSPYVALYFALQDRPVGGECAVWAIDAGW